MRLRKVLFVCAILCAQISWIESVFRPKPKCNQPINIYDNLKCKPKFGKQEKICPECYDCSQIDPKINKCYYQGKYYKIGEQIDDNANLPSCYVGCYCNDDLTFTCAVTDCAYPSIPDGCYFTNEVNQCCPSGLNCPDNNTLICNVGYDVYEGQTFQNPKDECSNCKCARGVTGDPGDPHCKKTACDVEITQSNYILGYCAAVYAQLTDCCPYDYMCPRDDDVFYSCYDSSSSSDSDSVPDSQGPRVTCDDHNACKQCRYGKSCYPLGTKFSRYVYDPDSPTDDWYQFTECECNIPPYFTCTRTFERPSTE